MTRYRFWLAPHGAVEILAPDEARAWSRLRAAGYADATVLGRPEAMGEAGKAVTLTEVMSTVRGGEGRP